MKLTTVLTITLVAILGIFAGGQAHAQDFDLVIVNGRVMDPETRYDAVANVGIKGGRIAVITKDKITGKETIDAISHMVAQGFIDTHWHCDRLWSNKIALRDGRTTILDPAIGTHGPHIDQWYKEREGKNQVNCGKVSEKMKRISDTVVQNPPDVTHVFIIFRKFIKEI